MSGIVVISEEEEAGQGGMKIPFVKMNGTGNDFILIDARSGDLDGIDRPEFVRKVCRRRESVGADGVIVIEKSRSADFSWDFYNSDGSVAEMCGNGARCAARFAHLRKIAGKEMTFETLAGTISARVTGPVVRVKLTDPVDFIKRGTLKVDGKVHKFSFINAGVPHTVLVANNLDRADVGGLGRKIRFHRRFKPAGTNVNFIEVKEGNVHVRTYERGVEGETLACGTGAVACSIAAYHIGLSDTPVTVISRSNEKLKVDFVPLPSGAKRVYLEGRTAFVCAGNIKEEALI